MINDLFFELFGVLDFSSPDAPYIFLLGCLCLIGIFQLLKMTLKLLFKH